MIHTPTLGTLLRHLNELLDGDVQRVYQQEGLIYRPRYTPVVRTLMNVGPSSIRSIARHACITHSATSQTVARMKSDGLVRIECGHDGREHIVTPTEQLRTMMPVLAQCWAAINAAAQELDDELIAPLSVTARQAITSLEARPFGERIISRLGQQVVVPC